MSENKLISEEIDDILIQYPYKITSIKIDGIPYTSRQKNHVYPSTREINLQLHEDGNKHIILQLHYAILHAIKISDEKFKAQADKEEFELYQKLKAKYEKV